MFIAGDMWERLPLAPAERHIAGDMSIAGDRWERLPLAPEGRHVYSRAIGPTTALQRSAMWRLSESRCFTGD